MLVKRSIVEKWFQTDSFVYKNFAYLFQNPLWKKNIPQGFTVCPYFWMSVFSLVIFRPMFVWPIQFIFRPILRALGKPAEAVDKWLFEFWQNRKVIGKYSSYASGIGSLATLGMTILVSLCVGLIGLIGVKLYEFYPYITSSRFGMFAFWSIASFLGALGVLTLHKKLSKTECNTMAYLYVWLALFIIVAPFVIPSEIGHGISTIAAFFGYIITTLASWVWISICFVAKWIWFGVSWTPMDALYIPWWGYFIALSGIAWLFGTLNFNLEQRELNAYRQQTTEEFWERNQFAWLGLLYRLVNVSDYYRKGHVFHDGDKNNPDWYDGILGTAYLNRAAYSYRDTIYRKSLELLMAEKLKELKKSYPVLKYDQWEKYVKENNLEGRFRNLSEILDDSVSNPHLRFDSHEFNNAIKQVVELPEVKSMLDMLIAEFDSKDKESRAKADAKKTSWATVTCKRVTTALTFGANALGQKIKWGCVQIGTFFAYLWILVKAKKQGACPYFKFTNPNDKQ
jgi:hypothetical protein